jgi:hypothetical protein
VNRRKGTSECRVLEQCEHGRGGTSREAVDSVTKAGGGINTKRELFVERGTKVDSLFQFDSRE